MIQQILGAAALLVFAIAPAARAQRIPGVPRGGYGAGPDYWVGLSYGYVDGMSVNDRETGADWRFGYSSQIRATFEKTIQRGVTAGVSAGFANVDLTYAGGAPTSVCPGQCDATADMSQYLVFVNGGSGIGFHGLYQLEAGITQLSNFREASTDTPLPPASARYDFTFGFGGGLGYQFSPTADAYVSEQLDFILHPQGVNGGTSAPRPTSFRAGFRIGF